MKRTNIFSILRYAAFACAWIASLLQAIAIFTNYGTRANYFHPGSVLPFIAALVAILSWVLGIVSGLPTKSADTNSSPIAPALLPSLPACIGFVGAAFGMFSTGVTATTLLVATLLLLSAIYCVFSALPKTPMLGCAAILGCALLNAYYYFDMSVEMNAPLKVLLQTALLFAMIYYTAELRFLLGRGMPRLYTIVAYATVAFCALAALAVPLAFLLGKFNRIEYATGGILMLGIALTVLLRIQHFYSANTPLTEEIDCKEESAE